MPIIDNLAIPHGEFEHVAARFEVACRTRDPSWGVRTRTLKAASLCASRSLMGSSNQIPQPRRRLQLAIPHGEFEPALRRVSTSGRLAIPHGEFELGCCGAPKPGLPRDPSWGVRTSEWRMPVPYCLAIPHGEFELDVRTLSSRSLALAIPHGEFELRIPDCAASVGTRDPSWGVRTG